MVRVMFLFGVNLWCYPKTVDIKDKIAHVASTGFVGVELVVGIEDYKLYPGRGFNEKWEEIIDYTKEKKLQVPSIATDLYWRFNWVLGEHLDDALKVFEMQSYLASIAGAKTILVVPGVAVPDIPYEKIVEKAVVNLMKAEKIADKYNVKVGLENVWNKFLAGPMEFKILLDKLNPEVYGLYLDVGNTLPHSLPEHWIDVFRDKILQVHVKDYNISRGFFGIPLTGDVNWANIRRKLEEIKYNGFLVAEIPPYKGDPYKAVEDTYTSLKKIFGD